MEKQIKETYTRAEVEAYVKECSKLIDYMRNVNEVARKTIERQGKFIEMFINGEDIGRNKPGSGKATLN